jgi:DNA polymerase II small subunit
VPPETEREVARELASRGYNAERDAVALIAGAADPAAAVERVVAAADPDTLTVTATDAAAALEGSADPPPGPDSGKPSPDPTADGDPSVSTGNPPGESLDGGGAATVETNGGVGGGTAAPAVGDRDPPAPSVAGDITGESTGTGEYGDFVAVFRDRYRQLAELLRSRVNHRPTDTIASMPGESDAAVVGMVNEVRSTASGHRVVELEDTNGVFPTLVMSDRDIAGRVEEVLLDEVVAVEGTLSDDGDILFADSLLFPDVPRTFEPSTADRSVSAALVSDVHVGSEEFMAEAWESFARWLHTEDAADVEYLLLAGDMVEGIGVYPDQDEELEILDIYDQYEAFSERLKSVPGDLEIVMIPGNHDAVRLAEPQPAFDEELRDIMAAHDARIVGNPSTVTIEGVSVLMYHGYSLDEVIAELPEEKASYGEPHRAMYQLLKKRHCAPAYGGKIQVAPEAEDHLVIDEVPDVFHAGHVHTLGVGRYHGVTVVNSGCWQRQTAFQRRNNLDPDPGHAPILDLDTLKVTVRKFG